MTQYSEYNTNPRLLLVNNPRTNTALKKFTQQHVSEHNFISVIDWEIFCEEYDNFLDILHSHDVKTIELTDVVSVKDKNSLIQNPNSIFTRDPIITLPWAPTVAIAASMGLKGRANEPELITTAVRKLGVTTIITPPDTLHIEGGDIFTIQLNGIKRVIVGIGSRTTKKAADWLADELFKNLLADEVVYVWHNKALLHLDTCFTILPHNVIVMANHALQSANILHKNGSITTAQPLEYFSGLGYRIVQVSQHDALHDEVCNLLYIGKDTYVSFNLPQGIKQRIEQMADVKIIVLPSTQIVKANGGAHCLTRPLY